ncbi:MAG: hypothetical protein HWD61_15280 [Parachlamydiaceae bacterium]|nr:MAG: hypothetical protein HWD61_15280 [Parachlamydiaceae bacterium]
MEQANLLLHKARVTMVGSSEINKKNYRWIQLNETIFHPKGGGQPSDEGTINEIPVTHVHKNIMDKSRLDQFEILHCFDEGVNLPFNMGDEVVLVVDATKRRLYSRYHTAGHLLAEAVNHHYPALQAYQGHHYPNEAYVKFKMLDPEISVDKEELKHKVQPQLQRWIEDNLPVSDLIHSGIRSIKITQEWSPCGGTHLQSLKEVIGIEIPDISFNKKKQW